MGMSDSEIRAKIAEVGPWSKDIRLSENVSTNPEEAGEARANYILQLVSQLFNGRLEGLRIIDLGCNEAEMAIEFAMHGAEVVAVDGREDNLAKPRLVKEILGIDNLTIVNENVVNLTVGRFGQFDVVLCFGLLYHLDDPHRFLKSICEMTRRLMFLNTHVAVPGQSQPHIKEERLTEFVLDGVGYWGKYFLEHPEVPDQDRLRGTPHASVHNPRSVWLAKHSLVAVLERVGFSYVLEDIRWNRAISRYDDTVLFVCQKLGCTVQPRTCSESLCSFDNVRPMCTSTVYHLEEEKDKFEASVKPFGYEGP
jgi:SAM-dependent methyltransferase